jgi:hypothetical protein
MDLHLTLQWFIYLSIWGLNISLMYRLTESHSIFDEQEIASESYLAESEWRR